MRRIAFMSLPRWPTDRRRRRGRAPPLEAPFALCAAGQGGVRLTAVDAAAQAQGLGPGQLLADARALVPALICQEAEPDADAAALARLARWAGRFSPVVAPVSVPAEGLFFEVDGVEHLFGGEAAWLGAVLQALRALGFQARGAVADTPGAAWGLACFHVEAARGLVAPPGQALALLAPLPAAALRLPVASVEGLRAVGLKRVGDVARMPRASLARRFGRAVIEALDRAGGALPEAVDAARPAPRFCVHVRLPAPLTQLPGVEAVLERLAPQLCNALDQAGRGARRFTLSLARMDGAALEVTLGAARPLKDEQSLRRLFARRLETLAERLDFGFGIEALTLCATATERLIAQARALDAAPEAEAVTDLSNRLAARLGEGALARLGPCDAHLPERAQTRLPRDAAPAAVDPRPDRPLLLFARPEPIEAMAEVPDGPPRRFRWRRIMHLVARAEGPERIAAEWARRPGPTRDYFRVETAEGRRFWLYREGLYGRETAAPRWFLHGSFG